MQMVGHQWTFFLLLLVFANANKYDNRKKDQIFLKSNQIDIYLRFF